MCHAQYMLEIGTLWRGTQVIVGHNKNLGFEWNGKPLTERYPEMTTYRESYTCRNVYINTIAMQSAREKLPMTVKIWLARCRVPGATASWCLHTVYSTSSQKKDTGHAAMPGEALEGITPTFSELVGCCCYKSQPFWDGVKLANLTTTTKGPAQM